MSHLILVINPGSTSTKVAVFRDEDEIAQTTIRHAPEELKRCTRILDQQDLRLAHILSFLVTSGIALEDLDAVVGRGGILKPVESGTYPVDEAMLADMHLEVAATHASVFGGLLAAELGRQYHIPAFVVDPVVVDEMAPYAKLSGFPGIERDCVFHALNAKAMARKCAAQLGKTYETSRFVVAHMGGGISVSAHKGGRAIDVNNAITGEGPFTPERCGGVPLKHVIELCFSGQMERQDILAMLNRRGGVSAYLGTSDMREVGRRIEAGDEHARLVAQSMAYQISKEIGAMVAALEGEVDAIVLTGGLANFQFAVDVIVKHVQRLGRVMVCPGEEEMSALALGALRVLRGEERAKDYGAQRRVDTCV